MKNANFTKEYPGEKIENKSLTFEILSDINNMLFAKDVGVNRFVGGQVVSLKLGHIPFIKSHRHLCAEKSDGIRYFLYICRNKSHPNFAVKRKRHEMDSKEQNDMIKLLQRDKHEFPFKYYLIDRKNEIYDITKLLNYDFKGEYLLDCEVVSDFTTSNYIEFDIYGNQHNRNLQVEKLNILIFDCMLAEDLNVSQKTFSQRRALCYERLIDKNKARNNAYFSLYMKEFFETYKITQVFDIIDNMIRHENDGVIFTKDDSPYDIMQSEHLLKWKPLELITVDLYLLKDDESTNIYAIAAGDENYSIIYLIPENHRVDRESRLLNKDKAKFDNVFIIEKFEKVDIAEDARKELEQYWHDKEKIKLMKELSLIKVDKDFKPKLIESISRKENLYKLAADGRHLSRKNFVFKKKVVIAECTYNQFNDCFEVKTLRTRFDKAAANQRQIVEGVKESTIEGIDRNKLIKLLE